MRFQLAIFLLLSSTIFIACNGGKNTPDISGITADLTIIPFADEVFSLDTNDLASGVIALEEKYPGFTRDYFENVLGLSADSVRIPGSGHLEALKLFLHDYRPLKDTADKIFGNFSEEKKELENACRYVKFYFPDYKLPARIYNYIGPVDAMFETSFGFQGDIKTGDAFGVALQFHLGEDFAFYKSLQGQAQFPDYILRSLTRKPFPLTA